VDWRAKVELFEQLRDARQSPLSDIGLVNTEPLPYELGAPDAVPVGNYEIVVTHQDGTVTRHGCFETDSDAINFAMLNRETLGLDRCKWYVAPPPPVDAPTGLGSSIKMSYFESFTKVDEKARHDFFERPWMDIGLRDRCRRQVLFQEMVDRRTQAT
jgi:hypothetical protein